MESCNKEQVETFEKTQNAQLSIVLNPYDSVGIKHNNLLDSLSFNKSNYFSIVDVLSETNQFYDISNIDPELNQSIENTQNYFENDPTSLMSQSITEIFLENDFSDSTKVKLEVLASIFENFIDLIDTDSINNNLSENEIEFYINDLILKINSLESLCLIDDNLPESERILVLSTISVSKKSLEYWKMALLNENHIYHDDLIAFSGSYKTSGLKLKKFLQGLIIVVTADAVGALFGAAGAMLPTNIAIMAGIMSTITAIGLLV